jgi:hypothetical protein
MLELNRKIYMKKPEKYRHIGYTLAFVLMMTGIAIIGFYEEYLTAGISLLNAGSILFFVTYLRLKRAQKGPMKDERTGKIGAYGLSYSWLITFILVSLLFWVEATEIARLTVKGVLIILMFTMIVTAKGIQWYLFRKGDIE